MSIIVLIILWNFVVLVRCQVCSTDTTLTLTDGENVVFSVDKSTKVTTAVELNAEKCNCNNMDVSTEIQDLKTTIMSLQSQLASLGNVQQSISDLQSQLAGAGVVPPKSIYYVWGRKSCDNANATLLFAGDIATQTELTQSPLCVDASASDGFVSGCELSTLCCFKFSGLMHMLCSGCWRLAQRRV
jgi:hypothetical protein